MQCFRCGTINGTGVKYCRDCGQQLLAPPVDEASETQTAQAAPHASEGAKPVQAGPATAPRTTASETRSTSASDRPAFHSSVVLPWVAAICLTCAAILIALVVLPETAGQFAAPPPAGSATGPAATAIAPTTMPTRRAGETAAPVGLPAPMILRTATASPAAAPPPRPSITPVPAAFGVSSSSYRENAARLTQTYGDAVTSLSQSIARASDKPTLLSDQTWIVQVALVMVHVKAAAEEIRRLSPPAELAAMHNRWISGIAHVDGAMELVGQAVDHADSSSLQQARVEIQAGTADLNAVTPMLK